MRKLWSAPAGLLFLGAVLIAPRQSLAAAPANDNFASLQVLSGPSNSLSGTTVGSTVEVGEPKSNYGNSVWYQYVTGSGTGTLSISLSGYAHTTISTIYTGTAVNALTQVASTTGTFSGGNSSTITTAANTKYDIQVVSSAASAFNLAWSFVGPPPNDDFSSLQTLSGVSGTVSGTTVGATLQANEPNPDNGAQGGSVWYRISLVTGKASFTVSGDATVTAYTGTSFAGLAPTSYYQPSNTSVFPTTKGTTYYIQVLGNSVAGSTFVLNYNSAASPANDLLANATALAASGGQISGTTLGASSGFDDPDGEQTYVGSVWYTLVPGTATVSLTASPSLEIGVYAGTSLTSVPAGASFAATTGTTYYIEVSDYNSGVPSLGTAFQFAWRVDPAPINDNFASATAISGAVGSAHGTTTGATADDPFEDGNDVWYRYTAPASSGGAVQFYLNGPSLNSMSLFTGSSISNLSPVDNGYSTNYQIDGVQPGSVIYVRVYVNAASGAPFTLQWQWNANPANDYFAHAQGVSGATGSVTGTTVGASTEALEPSIGYQSVWYRYTAPTSGNGRIQFSLSNYANNACAISAYSGSTLFQLTPLDSGDVAVTFQTSPGAVIYVQVAGVDGYSNTASPFTLAWNWVGAPANDNFASAQLLSGASGTVAGSTVGSSTEFNEPSSFFFLDSSVWYRYVTPATGGNLGLTVSGYVGGASGLTVYTGSSLGALNRVASGVATASFATTPSTTYWVQVQGQGPDAQSTSKFNLGWSLTGSVTSKSSRSSTSSPAIAATAPSGHSS